MIGFGSNKGERGAERERGKSDGDRRGHVCQHVAMWRGGESAGLWAPQCCFD